MKTETAEWIAKAEGDWATAGREAVADCRAVRGALRTSLGLPLA